MKNEYYAHSIENEPPDKWQVLEDHLNNVRDLAGQFAALFNADAWGKIAGENHDIGKGLNEWQAWLRRVNGIEDEFSKNYIGHVNHAIYGAKRLFELSQDAGKLIAYCIAGHHGGLSNWIENKQSSLKSRLEGKLPEIKIHLKKPEVTSKLPIKKIEPKRFGFQLQFFVRMIFSCLVDADFLDTESFLDKEKSSWRSTYPPISELYDRFFKNFNEMRNNADDTDVNKQREIVLKDCLVAAKNNPGLFSLTVPTGGGKTLSSLAFALEHAKFSKFKKRKIIYVIPFTSIIEQNASVFRDILGEDAVLEHHCNFIPDESDWKTRLASENWDAPVIVTTNVQFFNSFYSRKPSKCRKLHNVAESIIIFDEVQTIPVEKLQPCLEILKELTLNYGVTAVLCTATQPAIEYSENFKSGLKDLSEIIQDIPSLFGALKRTKEEFIGKTDEKDIADQLAGYDQVLCIVNTRKQASNLFELLPEQEGNFHLSALMHPRHRSQKLSEIRSRLKEKLPCRVISTQLIEAGVDVDFSVVYRAIAGMDSIAQAAGRCNREGKIKTGKVKIFKFENESSHIFFRQTAQCAEELLEKFSGQLLEPECIHEYFLNYYWHNEHRMDSEEIVHTCLQGLRGNIQFEDISKFQMIESASIPIIIAIEAETLDLVKQLEFIEHATLILRKLQQYTVQIYPYQMDAISGWLETPKPGIYVLRSPELYSEETGLICETPAGEAFFA